MKFVENSQNMRSPQDVTRRALSKEITLMLAECTEGQRSMFKSIFAEDVDDIKFDDLERALTTLQRTVARNNEGRKSS